MAVSPRLIKRRIRSVTNTRKITKALELVSASKMRKAVQMTQASRDYAKTIDALVADVRKLVQAASHPLLTGRSTARASLLIIAASDRGLCGGFNSQLLKKSIAFAKARPEPVRVITVGKRAESAVRKAGLEIVAAFDAVSNEPSYERARPVGDLAVQEFAQGRADRVFFAYMDYRTAMRQVASVIQLLPATPETELSSARSSSTTDEPTDASALFEPSPDDVLDTLLPRLIDTLVYQSLLESAASEHAARMLAMRSATDNANNMIADLTLTYNQARQANITREISEISAGKAAVE